MNQQSNLLKTSDLARIFDTTHQTIMDWRKEGMPFYGSKKSLRYDLEEVKKWHKNRDSEGKAKEVIEKNYKQ